MEVTQLSMGKGGWGIFFRYFWKAFFGWEVEECVDRVTGGSFCQFFQVFSTFVFEVGVKFQRWESLLFFEKRYFLLIFNLIDHYDNFVKWCVIFNFQLIFPEKKFKNLFFTQIANNLTGARLDPHQNYTYRINIYKDLTLINTIKNVCYLLKNYNITFSKNYKYQKNLIHNFNEINFILYNKD